MASLAMTTVAAPLALQAVQSSQPSAAPSSVGFSTGSGVRLVARASLGRRVVAYASPNMNEKVEQSIKDAEKICAEDPVSAECKVQWDEVEELSAAAAHRKEQAKNEKDPLENFCKDNPETDECRVYDN